MLYFCKVMKFLTFILAITILFLTAKPGIDTLSLQSNISNNCCVGECLSLNSIKKSHEKQKQSKEQKGKTCNPFQNCNTCVLCILPSTIITQASKHKIATLLNFDYQTNLNPQFKPDFWQPPKIV